MWKIKDDDIEEAVIPDEDKVLPFIAAPIKPRYKIIKEVTHNDVRYPPDTVLPDNLIRPDGIEWLVRKGALEKIEE